MDPAWKRNWEAENVIVVRCPINKHQDPELYEMLMTADSKSAVARELIRLAMEVRNNG